jgi:hypothetical protein
MRDNIEKCVDKVKALGARPILMTPQAADVLARPDSFTVLHEQAVQGRAARQSATAPFQRGVDPRPAFSVGPGNRPAACFGPHAAPPVMPICPAQNLHLGQPW